MAERPFQIYGDSVPKMIGRKKVMDRLRRGLVKAVPDHMKIVGPRSAGKTVVIEALVAELQDKGDHFRGVVRWDLGLGRAANDDEFLAQLREHVAAALDHHEKDWAEMLRTYP